MRTEPVVPHVFVIFGATGDLTARKLLPALYDLADKGFLPRRHAILGVSRSREMDDARFRAWARGILGDRARSWCDTCLHFRSIGAGAPDDYRRLGAEIDTLERAGDLPGNRVYYLALPPAAVPSTVVGLGEAGLSRSRGWTRLVVEKPFGWDLDSARQLNALVHRYFEEPQVYRIDHYLGKETVQNLLVLRFANPVFESVWNRDRVESVEITVAEDEGIGRRVAFYEQAGALRDVVQNHLTQLLTLVAMEVPVAFEADAIRDEKVKVLRAVAPLRPRDAVFGQYAAGEVGGRAVPGYRQEEGVASDSRTETFVALRLSIENWRWQGVPFYLRTGKRLPRKLSRIVVRFRRAPVTLFQSSGGEIHANQLVITLQPDEGFDLYFEVKSPLPGLTLQTERLRFRYSEALGALPDAYETLLYDVLTGDATLFVRDDEIEHAWRLYAPLIENPPPVHLYPASTWGPDAAEGLPQGGWWHGV
ncbi:MAG: glucose-6-phosphate dehydrogenase [Armatimonadota bacterium]|nr:glucose-6-phosphate dehydrogenase [Armatimonadota bacterium]MDR5698036.1 glucose-6-phosphate dehydrogenase [Armatimonadota bacterium]